MKRILYRAQLTVAAKHVLEEICDHSGRKQNDLTEVLLEWFAASPDHVQKHVMGLIPKAIEREIATLILNRQSQR